MTKQEQNIFTIWNKEHPEANAYIDNCHGWERYINGYTEGAKVLIVTMLSEGAVKHTLIYPICFMLRHALELRFKQLIETCNKLLNPETKNPTHHKLKDLSDLAIEKINKVQIYLKDNNHGDIPNLPTEMKKKIITAARTMHDIDEMSDVFRYPIHKNKNNTLPPEAKSIDCLKVYEIINVALEDVSAINCYLDNILDYFKEMKNDMREYY